MSNLMEAFGATLLAGSELAGRRRLQQRQDDADARAKEAHLMQMALLGQQKDATTLDLAQKKAAPIMSAGPNARISPADADVMRAAGYGARVRENSLPGEFSFAANAGGGLDIVPGANARPNELSIAPTVSEQQQIDAAKRQEQMQNLQITELQAGAEHRARQTARRRYIETPEFWKQSIDKRQVAWAEAGYSGNAPMTEAELQRRLDDEQKKKLEQVDHQGKWAYDRAFATRSGMTDGQEFGAAMRLRQRYMKETEISREIGRQYNIMKAGMDAARKGDLNAGSQAVLVTFQKILDPDSVVRESEYARSPQGVAILKRIEGALMRLKRGGPGVPLPELESFDRMARQFVEDAERSAKDVRLVTKRTADEYRIPLSVIFDPTDLQELGAGQPNPIPTNDNPNPSSQQQVQPGSTPQSRLLVLGPDGKATWK